MPTSSARNTSAGSSATASRPRARRATPDGERGPSDGGPATAG